MRRSEMSGIARVTLLACILGGPVWADTLHVSADSQTNSGAPTMVAGSAGAVAVSSGSGSQRRTFLRFDLSTLPADAVIDKAVLRLFVAKVTRPGGIDVLPVLDAWEEASLTHATAPALGTTVGGFGVATGDLEDFVVVDVTGLVRDWHAGALPNRGLALVGSVAKPVSVAFDSKESIASSHAPELEVVLTAIVIAGPPGPSGPTGPQGPPGPTGLVSLDDLAGTACAQGTGATRVVYGTSGSVTLVCQSNACGNGIVDPGEQCDDGNQLDGDGCESDCRPTPASTHAVILRQGAPNRTLLRGLLVTPDEAYAGELLIVDDLIQCAGASCNAEPAAADATIVQTNGLILPGLIDTHNHVLFDAFDETDWTPETSYTNHDAWTREPGYQALVDAKQSLTGGSGSTADLSCELAKYGEIKGLIAGTTSIVGAAGSRRCYASLARTIDTPQNGLPADRIQTSSLTPTADEANSVCARFADGTTDAFLVHIGEGVDSAAAGEFARLASLGSSPGCLISPKTTIVHGTALGALEFEAMGQSGMSLSWAPRSDVALYGRTANVPSALANGVNVAIGPNWSVTGSQNILDELRFADHFDASNWGDAISPRQLTQMVTTNAARALGLGATLGRLAPGYKADIAVIGGDARTPWASLVAATPASMRLVLVDGRALYGEEGLLALSPVDSACERIGILGAAKFLCVAQSGGTSADKLGQSLGDVESALAGALLEYDAVAPPGFSFSPLAALVRPSP